MRSGRAAGGSFSLLRFPEPDLPDVVYLEQLTSALYLDRRADVDSYHAVMERLCLQAAPATESLLAGRSSETAGDFLRFWSIKKH